MRISELVEMLPRSLRSVAGTPQKAGKKKPATPVGMTAQDKSKAQMADRKIGHYCLQESLSQRK